VRKFVVSEDSMLPALRPGDGLVAVRSMRLRRGQVRCFEHPDRPGFWLVKRVGGIRGTDFEARSDNDAPGATDSRRFGYVPAEGSYRMVARVPRRLIGGGTGSNC
jgi:phage repressor protein C with HTH and peptisase S24 domain